MAWRRSWAEYLSCCSSSGLKDSRTMRLTPYRLTTAGKLRYTSSLPLRRGTPLPFVSSVPKYRRRRARSHCPSFSMSFPIVFHLHKQSAGTRERALLTAPQAVGRKHSRCPLGICSCFGQGPLTRDWLSARKAAIREAEECRGDLSSIGMTQITWKGIDLHGAHTQHPGGYCRGLGNASSSRWHGISHRFTWVRTGGSRGKEIRP